MKKDEIKVGETYIAKVTGVRAAVRIEAENPRGGWEAVNIKTNRKVRIKSPQRLQRKAELKAPAPATSIPTSVDQSKLKVPLKAASPPAAKEKAGKKTAATHKRDDGVAKTSRPEKQGGMSCLDAAAMVLGEAGQPMTTKAMIEAMADKGYWASDAATPWATLYSAIAREIKTRGDQSRFAKAARGQFELQRFDPQTLQSVNGA